MDKVRFGIIGVGGMGSGHARTMQSVEKCELTAVCDVDSEAVESIASEYDVKAFTDYKELIDIGLVDAVIVATPHYFHPPISVYAMKKGLAVLSEKPIAVTVSAADEMVKTAKETGVPFAVMYQSRTSPINQAVNKLIEDGRLGEIYRTCMISPWFRSQAYYESGGWRGTWKGEGGGVLINQAPHDLDLFSWFAGLPSKITARTDTRRHNIEVEDEASAMLEYPNGAIGYLHISTTEVPSNKRIELCGEKGKVVLNGGELIFYELETPIQEFTDNSEQMWGSPNSHKVEVELEDRETGHIAIIRNLVENILHDEPLIAPGVEGLNSMELINGILLSGNKGEPVQVPVDRDEYDAFIEEKKRTSEIPDEEIWGSVKRETDPNHVK